MSRFSLDIAAFVERTQADLETVVKKTTIHLLNEVVNRSPVGNPELWAANAIATEYNNEVARYNAELRNDPANLTRSGRLKRGLAVNDSMPLTSGAGYVGGRFRGNWQVSFDAPAPTALDLIDPQGASTIRRGLDVIVGFDANVSSVWLTNNVRYASRLEYGWSKQAPSGVVRVSLAGIQSYINQIVREVREYE